MRANIPGGCGERAIKGAKWPHMGFDEWFLLAALYPRIIGRGVLTLASAKSKSKLLS